jgi:hypothetical protein
MGIKRMSPDPDRIISAHIYGTASRHTGRGEPTGDARAAAIEELREAASQDGKLRRPASQGKLRTDLLSQEVGLLTGLAEETDGNEWHCRQLRWMAALCREAAGEHLDQQIVTEWIVIGKARANPPMSGPKLS